MFFLPFGYDFLFKFLLDYTGSYMIADSIFYGISFMFFCIYAFTTNSSPVDELQKRAFETKIKLMELRSKL